MNRRQQREAYARRLKALGDWQKADPVAFERTLRQFNYLRSTAYFLFFAYLFQFSLVRLLSEPSPIALQFAQSYPLQSTAALICAGVLLYCFRDGYRYYYGLTEAAFACALIYVGVDQLEHAPSQAVPAIGAALYVLVRGLDNLIQGYKSPPILYADEP